MQRKLTPKEILNLSNESILENLNNPDSFDNETVLILYAEAQERSVILSPDLLFKLLDFSSKIGWEDLNVEILNYAKQEGFDSYKGFRDHCLSAVENKVTFDLTKEVSLTPLVNSANPTSAGESNTDLLSKQMNEVVDAISNSGDDLGKVFGSLIGQICSIVGYVIFMALIAETAVSRVGRDDGYETITGLYALLSLFFFIRMLVFLSRASSRLRNIKFSLSR
jgi:hypothetical protein